MFDVSVECQRDCKIPISVRPTHQSSPYFKFAESAALRSPNNAFDQTSSIVICHVERQSDSPPASIKIKPSDSVEASTLGE
jgi:hypothetical protein